MLPNSLSASIDLLTILLEYASGLKIDEQAITSATGIDLSALRSERARVPLPAFHTIWSVIAKGSADPDFGLHFGEQAHPLLSRHLLYAMMMNCEDVGRAIQKNFQYHNLITDIIRPVLTVKTGLAVLTWEMGHPVLSPERHLSESVLATFVSMLRFLTEGRCTLTEIRFAHPRPQSTVEHQRIFKAPLAFNWQQNEIVLPQSYLKSPILLANPAIEEGLEQLVQKTLHGIYTLDSWKDKVARILFEALVRGEKIGIETTAQKLIMTTRNLQHKLKEEGTSFRKLLEDVRKEIAVGCLKEETASICEIALLLGFADQSAFQHAFKRWTGKTPGAYRLKGVSGL